MTFLTSKNVISVETKEDLNVTHCDDKTSFDAANYTRAYILGTKLIKEGHVINTYNLVDSTIQIRPKSFLID